MDRYTLDDIVVCFVLVMCVNVLTAVHVTQSFPALVVHNRLTKVYLAIE